MEEHKQFNVKLSKNLLSLFSSCARRAAALPLAYERSYYYYYYYS